MEQNKKILLICGEEKSRDLVKTYLMNPDTGTPPFRNSLIGRLLSKKIPFEKLPQTTDTCVSPYIPNFAGTPDEAIRFFSDAANAKAPYSLLLIDMDTDGGIELIRNFYGRDQLAHMILLSTNPDSIFTVLRKEKLKQDNLLILKKPLNKAEFLQAVLVLSEKCDAARRAGQKLKELKEKLDESSSPGMINTDTVVFNAALITEMTQRRNAESELQNAKDNLERIFMSLPLALIVADAEGRVVQWNSNAESLCSIKKETLHNSMITESFQLLNPFAQSIIDVLEKLSKKEFRNVEYVLDDKLYFNIFMCPLTSNNIASGIVVMIDDITNDRRKDEYLRQAQKMDIVGNLASGIAHDFNNVLGAIGAMFSSVRYSVQTAKNLDKLRNDVKNDLEVIDDAVKHGSDMVDQLRALAKKKELEFSKVDLIQVVDKVIKICRSTLPKSIEIVVNNYCKNDAYVMAYPSQIEQILLNLCVNASHAMTIMRKENEALGGTLTVSIEQVFPGAEFAKILPDASDGAYYLLRVWDTGIGMTQEIMKKVFDPFFTTKEKKGTGLGLSMVYNIVQQHKGFVEVYSEPGNGSVFNVFLPSCGNEDTEKPEKME